MSRREKAMTREIKPFRSSVARTAEPAEYVCEGGV